jgi:hypothetical protein
MTKNFKSSLNDNPLVVLITVTAAIIAIVVFVTGENSLGGILESKATVTKPDPKPTATTVITPSSTPLPPCPYQAHTDKETLTALIHAEVEAVLSEELWIIDTIFADTAHVRDERLDRDWHDPLTSYQERLSTLYRG